MCPSAWNPENMWRSWASPVPEKRPFNILAALDRPTAGEVRLNGQRMGDIREKELAAFRRKNLGFVFQDFNLLDTFSLRDNIFLPLVLSGCPIRKWKAA